jgi:hypothetical protein
VVPVVDVLFEGDDFEAAERLLVGELFKEGVGGRATGAAFGGEEFDDDGLLGGGGGGVRSGTQERWHKNQRYIGGGEEAESKESMGAHTYIRARDGEKGYKNGGERNREKVSDGGMGRRER